MLILIQYQYSTLQVMRQGLVQDYDYKQQDPTYMGEPFELVLADGPREDRKCRDVICLILYIAFWAGLIIVAVFAFSKGNPQLLAAPFDSSGKQCGYAPGYEDYDFAYFNATNPQIFCCINQCPTANGLTTQSKCIMNSIQIPCATFGNYSTTRVVGICYPQDSIIAQGVSIGLNFYSESIADLEQTWPISLSVIFITLIISIIVLFLIRCCGGCIVISVIVLYFTALVALGVILLQTSYDNIDIDGLNDLIDPQVLQICAYVCFGITGISLLILICSIRKIRIGIMIIKTTAVFTQQQCQTILVPFFMFIAISAFFVLWITISIFIFSAGTIAPCNGAPYACIDWDNGVKRSLGFYFFGLFWNCQVAIGICQFVIASTTSYWYFSHLKRQRPDSPVSKSFCRAMTYHLGSIAFGGLILCILFILQLFFQLLHSCTKQKTVSGDPITNACTKFCISCTRCCLACFERFVRFISRNAFIMMAITGSSFCQSAHEAFYLIIKSSRQYAITHGVGHLIMFFGKLFITAVSTLIGYVMITQIDYFSDKIFSPFMPTLIFFVISFVISSLFMDVFGIGSDALLMCYCLEKDILKGVARACPQKLKAVLEG